MQEEMIVKSVIAIGISEGQPPMALLDAVSTKRHRDLSRAGYLITAGIGFAAIVAAAYRRPQWLRVPASAGTRNLTRYRPDGLPRLTRSCFA
jgi:hypothetical protein